MRRKIIFTLTAFLFLFPLIGIAFNSVQLLSSYRSIPNAPISEKQAKEIGNSLHRDTEDLLRYLSLPGIRQLAEFAGLDIFEIKPEFLFITKHFPELAGYEIGRAHV